MWLEGEAGRGKSALMEAFHEKLLTKTANFCQAKSEQVNYIEPVKLCVRQFFQLLFQQDKEGWSTIMRKEMKSAVIVLAQFVPLLSPLVDEMALENEKHYSDAITSMPSFQACPL
uniref:Uncharacterized protein n=1 Tax=Amphora coffeiformis TaxID=265554 RepID=A0A7S3L813_9STRA|mmetsp:Transcript_7320/g.14912  ORF Transcript_7320/g.14912 Transcript_7320/m.14912 type:complete len:115 (+) Transcript_7320:186-530(+)